MVPALDDATFRPGTIIRKRGVPSTPEAKTARQEPRVRTLTAAQAAIRLGMSDHGVRDMIHAGRLTNLTAAGHYPYTVTYDDVTRVMHDRRAEALRAVGDEVDFAHRIRRQIWPNTKVATRANGEADAAQLAHALNATSGRRALPLLPENARKLWGTDVLTACATTVSSGVCRTCLARAAAAIHETMPPRETEAHRVLLGPACGQCTQAFAADRKAAKREIRRMHQAERAYRDARTLAEFDDRQRQVLATVKQASSEFARLAAERKRAGLPPLGGRR